MHGLKKRQMVKKRSFFSYLLSTNNTSFAPINKVEIICFKKNWQKSKLVFMKKSYVTSFFFFLIKSMWWAKYYRSPQIHEGRPRWPHKRFIPDFLTCVSPGFHLMWLKVFLEDLCFLVPKHFRFTVVQNCNWSATNSPSFPTKKGERDL